MIKKRLISVWLALLLIFGCALSAGADAASLHAGKNAAVLQNVKPGEEPEYALPEPNYPEIIAGKAADHAARLP